MNIQAAITAGKGAIKIGRMIVKYLKDDYGHWLGIGQTVTFDVSGVGCGGVNFANPILRILSLDADHVSFTVHPFDPASHFWNGASLVKDADQGKRYDDGRTEASLVHDLIAEWLVKIAAHNGKTQDEISDWADKILAVMWRAYGRKKKRDGFWLNLKTKIAMNLCGWKTPRKIWSALFRVAVVALIGLSMAGCDDVPDWDSTTPDIIYYSGSTNAATGGSL